MKSDERNDTHLRMLQSFCLVKRKHAGQYMISPLKHIGIKPLLSWRSVQKKNTSKENGTSSVEIIQVRGFGWVNWSSLVKWSLFWVGWCGMHPFEEGGRMKKSVHMIIFLNHARDKTNLYIYWTWMNLDISHHDHYNIQRWRHCGVLIPAWISKGQCFCCLTEIRVGVVSNWKRESPHTDATKLMSPKISIPIKQVSFEHGWLRWLLWEGKSKFGSLMFPQNRFFDNVLYILTWGPASTP